MPAKGKKKQEEEAPEDLESAEPVVVEPPDPFDRYEEIWVLPTLGEQRTRVGEIFELPDGPPHSLQALTLDNSFQHLLFTKENGMNQEQAKGFYRIMMELKDKLADTSTDMAAAYALFKDTLMKNSMLLAPPPKRKEEVKKEPEPEPEVDKRSASRNSKRGGKPKTGKNSAMEVEEPPPEPPKPEKPLLENRFTQAHILAMTDYAATGLFGHYLLHRAVFDAASFVPNKFIHTANVRVQSVVPDGRQLMHAADVDEEDAQLAEERRQEEEAAEARRLAELVDVGVDVDPDSAVGKLVEAYVKKARDTMLTTLQTNAQTLESRFDEVATKIKATGAK